MDKYVYVVQSNPGSGQEKAYNRWYNEQHLLDVLAIPGFTGAQRFELADGSGDAKHRYMAVYEIESDNVQQTMQELVNRAGDGRMPMTESMETESVSAVLYRAITPRHGR